MNKTRILICGSRDWTNQEVIASFINALPLDTVVIQGACKGADMIARRLAYNRGLGFISYPALWNVHGKAAGSIRNSQMLKEGNPNLVWGFHNDISTSRGTRDMLTKAVKAGKPTCLINSKYEVIEFKP